MKELQSNRKDRATMNCLYTTNSAPLRSRRHNRNGAAVVELAVVLPLFVLILMGTIETCKMIFLQQSLEIAAYEASRVTIVPTSKVTEVENAAISILRARRVNDATITVTPSNFQNAAYGSFIRVDVSAPCDSNAPFLLRFYSSKSLTGTVEMMKEF